MAVHCWSVRWEVTDQLSLPACISNYSYILCMQQTGFSRCCRRCNNTGSGHMCCGFLALKSLVPLPRGDSVVPSSGWIEALEMTVCCSKSRNRKPQQVANIWAWTRCGAVRKLTAVVFSDVSIYFICPVNK